MKKLLVFIMTLTVCVSLASPAFASYDYVFESGADSESAFGKPTSTDEPVSADPMTENVRRNKDAAYLPPPYGIFSGEIPTDPSSLYHNNSVSNGTVNGGGTTNIATSDALLPSTSLLSDTVMNTAPLYYEDGSIGSLYIPSLKKTIKVYEGETLENMKKGIGHFTFTSAWDGNCGFAGHNRGAASYFYFVKDLSIGDTIIYRTLYGEREYKIYRKEKISETDYSGLGWSAENTVSLISCVENQSDLRWLVQAREVK